MDGITCQSRKNKFIVSFDRNKVKDDDLLNYLRWLKIESAAQIINFSDDLLEVGEDIKNAIWEKRKSRVIPNEKNSR